MTFTCFYTAYKESRISVPVTAGYDANPGIASWLASLHTPQFIHSGNWWNIKPEKRTREIVLNRQLALVNKRTVGLMSTNVQPGNDPLYWVNNEKDESHLQNCLDNANYARDVARSKGVPVPVYCALQPANVHAAEDWFQRAIDDGHIHLCIGVSEFLRSPRYRNDGTKRILEMSYAIKQLLSGKNGFIHLSGLTSYNLLPVVAALGTTSTDGSTPVQSALAYGTVFKPWSGKGMSASTLWERKEIDEWECTCDSCRARSKEENLRAFMDPVERVNHNLGTWERLVHEINDHMLMDPTAWYVEHKARLSPASKKPWAVAIEMLEQK